MAQFTITEETSAQLERRKEQIEREMACLRDEHQLITRKLEAIPLFLADANGASTNGHGAEPAARVPRTPMGLEIRPPRDAQPDLLGDHGDSASVEMSMPMKVKLALQEHGRMTTMELRDVLLKMGVERERFGATYSYLYTVLGRLEQRGHVQKARGKYQLTPGITHQYRPSEDDLKP